MVRKIHILFLLFSLTIITGLFPGMALADTVELVNSGSTPNMVGRAFEGIVHPYTGFRCLDRSPIVGGNLTFEVNTTAIQNGPETFRYLKVDWGDGSAPEIYETPYHNTETGESQPVPHYKVHHVYTRAEPFVIRVQGANFQTVLPSDHTYCQELLMDLSLKKGDILVHSIDDTSVYSSPLSPYVPGHWTHAGMYIGENKVLEAGGHGIAINDIADWAYPRDVCVAIFRVPGLREEQRNNVVNWGLEKVDHRYDFQSLTGLYGGKQRDCDVYSCLKSVVVGGAVGTLEAGPIGTVPGAVGGYFACKEACGAYYCSELVWASYERNGINLDPIDGCVYPMDTVLGRYVPMEFVGCHMEYLPHRVKAYSSTHDYYRMLMGLAPGSIVRGESLDPLPPQPKILLHADSNDEFISEITGGSTLMNGEASGESSFFMLMVVANANEIEGVKNIRPESCEGCVKERLSGEELTQVVIPGRFTMTTNPFDTIIIAPDGTRLSENASTIPESGVEILDVDHDPFKEFLASIEAPMEGEYRICVIPNTMQVSPYTYTLRIGAWDLDQVSWIGPVVNAPFSSLPEGGTITVVIEENGLCRIVAAPVRGNAPLEVSFMDISPLAKSNTLWDYDTMKAWNEWEFGDGTTAVNQTTVTHLYREPGEYRVTLTTRNETMSASAILAVNVEGYTDALIADFFATPFSGPAPLAVSFSDRSSGNPSEWNFQFRDGANSRRQNPVHTYTKPGTYNVSLTVRTIGKGGISTDTVYRPALITVTGPVSSPLAADFSASPTSGKAPLLVQFTDSSSGDPTGFLYRFGDGSVTCESNPAHTYRKPGVYAVTLKVWKIQQGKMVSNTTVHENAIHVE
ncbi:MAG: hypothetical protein A4E42_01168 [Methanoregulaceae archaeon PtaU1.Bin222]|nr:MAG: hypothetical protein A4E42_01168 [Methanoregulaceae archaeon PtaU1.Bin222]